jgi:hypothetical protein
MKYIPETLEVIELLKSEDIKYHISEKFELELNQFKKLESIFEV